MKIFKETSVKEEHNLQEILLQRVEFYNISTTKVVHSSLNNECKSITLQYQMYLNEINNKVW